MPDLLRWYAFKGVLPTELVRTLGARASSFEAHRAPFFNRVLSSTGMTRIRKNSLVEAVGSDSFCESCR